MCWSYSMVKEDGIKQIQGGFQMSFRLAESG